MKKTITLLLCLVSLWGYGQTTATYSFSASGAVTGLNEAAPGITLDANIGFGSFKNSGTSNPALVSSQLRLYQNATKGGSIKIYANNGVTITSVQIFARGTTGPAAYTVDGGAATDLGASTTYDMSSISAASEIEFYQKDGSSSNRIYVDSFSVTYNASTGGAPTAPAVAAANPTPAAKDVISLYSDVYDDVAVSTWRTDWTPGATVLTDTTAAGNNVKRYTNLDFVGIEFTGANSLDVSVMEYMSFDVWSPNIDTIQVKLVDWGADNSFGGGDDKEHEIAINNVAKGQWVNVQLKLSDFTGLTSRANLSQLIFSARPVGSNPTVYLDNIIFWKEPTIVYNKVNIADARQLDSNLAPLNKDTLYEFTGIVYGIDYRGGNGLSFTLIDETAGINIFNFSDVNDYVVTEGDEITVRGKMDFFRGLLQLFVDSIAVNSQGNALKAPTLVAAPSEETESDLIQLEKVWITNDTTTVWPNGRNVQLTNENNDTFLIRIDRNVLDVVGTPVLFDTMTIIGLGGQFDNSAPYDEGYQIFPRRLSDIAEYVDKTSVKEIAIETRVYPNPTSSNLTVIGSAKWNTFKVYSLVGSEVSIGTLINNNLSVANLQNGTYIIKLYAADKVGVARFIVNR